MLLEYKTYFQPFVALSSVNAPVRNFHQTFFACPYFSRAAIQAKELGRVAQYVLVTGANGNLDPSLMNELLVQKHIRKPDFKFIAVLTSQEGMRGFATQAEKGVEVIGGSWFSAESFKGSSHLNSPVSPLEIGDIKVSGFRHRHLSRRKFDHEPASSNDRRRSRGWHDAFLTPLNLVAISSANHSLTNGILETSF
jgi:hypothetical protein